jgi:hypothetical protein
MEPFLPSTHGHFRAGAASHDPLQPQRVPPLVRIRRLDPRRVLQITHAPCVAIKEDEEVALIRVFALPPRTPIHLLPFLQLVVAIEHGRLASGAWDPGDGNTGGKLGRLLFLLWHYAGISIVSLLLYSENIIIIVVLVLLKP